MEYNYELLHKCHGLRFRATIAGKPQEGIIKVTSEGVMLCYGDKDPGYLVTFGRRDTLSFSKETSAILPNDFKIVPRDPETYKDWQVGDKVKSISANTDGKVIFRSGRLVVLEDHNGQVIEAFTCDEVSAYYLLVLTDIEKRMLEEKKRIEDIPKMHELKKGDLVLARIDRSAEWNLRVFEGRVDGSDRQFKASVDGFLYIYQYCIPYNEETKHLLGTTDDYEEGK